jgi:hypothetical protein
MRNSPDGLRDTLSPDKAGAPPAAARSRQAGGRAGLGLALVAPGSVIALAAYAGAGQVDWRSAALSFFPSDNACARGRASLPSNGVISMG